MFCSFFKFNDLPSNLDWIIFHKFQKWDITNKISKNCRRIIFHLDIAVNNKTGYCRKNFGCWVVTLKR